MTHSQLRHAAAAAPAFIATATAIAADDGQALGAAFCGKPGDQPRWDDGLDAGDDG